MPTSDTDWTRLLARYQVAFSFLSQVFREKPRPEFHSHLANEDHLTRWPLDQGAEETRRGLQLMRSHCAKWDERRLIDLETDFNRLFVGPGGPLAPPWESYYLSRDRLLFQEQTLAVRESYREFGLSAPDLHGEPDDSLGLELGFMAELCAMGLDAVRNGATDSLFGIVRGQQAFLRDHLNRWAPECLARIVTHAREEFYQGAAGLARGSLDAATAELRVG